MNILSTAVRVAPTGSSAVNDRLAKVISQSLTKFEKFKAENEKIIKELEGGRDAWKSSGAQAYIDRLNANRMYREYAELEGPFIAYWNAHLSANEVKSSEASN